MRLVRGDVTDPPSVAAALEGVGAVYHLAGKTHALSLADFLAVNEAGVQNVCRAAAERSAPPVVVVVSSLSAAGPSASAGALAESVAPAPVSDYGRSKLAGERAARESAAAAPITIVRPPVVFGPGDRDGLVMFRAIRRWGVHLAPQLDGVPLSLVAADDLVDALLRAAERGERIASAGPPGQGVYHVADPQVSSYAEMGRLAADAMGRRVWVLRRRKYPFLLPAMAGDLLARLRGKPSIVGMDKLREATAPGGWVCSSQKAIETLGWAPAASLEERYRQTAEAYRAAGWL
ncbi:NAD dependent epimerase/dehydratase family protein [Pseudobythopirellula maris]|uniref:NAD dependent epimerase/dehydratase family protein n=1 Tax=Pseudobythopirellula maris TaxID=2527991 RepID=A0A5C5ZNM9_9BACT|nr:NAD dependent epimerase/dehydratase family protein [Pseudobythopirellula maris]